MIDFTDEEKIKLKGIHTRLKNFVEKTNREQIIMIYLRSLVKKLNKYFGEDEDD